MTTENTTEDLSQATPDVETTTTPEAREPNETALRESIAAAFDSYGKKEEAGQPTPIAPPTVEKAEIKAEPTVDPITGRTIEPIKPPASMPPGLREKWASVDPQYQKYWVDRERDMSQQLNKTAEERKFAKEMREVLAPHEEMLRGFGTTGAKHVGELLNLSRNLTIGSPQQKAAIIHELIMRVQPDAQTLTALFQGQHVPLPPIEAAKAQRTDEQIAQDYYAKQEQERFSNEASQTMAQFAADPANEFFEDVRQQMSGLINAGIVQGETTADLFRAAYDLAVSQNRDIQAVLAQRAQVQAQAQATTPAQIPRAAKPSLGAGKPSKVPQRAMTSREAAEAAWNAHNS